MPRLNSISSVDDDVIGDHRIGNFCKKPTGLMSSRAAVIRSDIYNQVPNHVIVGDADVVITAAGFDRSSAIGVTRCNHIVDIIATCLIETCSGTSVCEDNAVCVTSRDIKTLDGRVAAAQADHRGAVPRTCSYQFRLPLILGLVNNGMVGRAT